jgi:hypothetical protein
MERGSVPKGGNEKRYNPQSLDRTVEKNMDLSILEYGAKSPHVVRRSGGDWLAVTPPESRLTVGVTASSEAEVREKFSWTIRRWIEILASDGGRK